LSGKLGSKRKFSNMSETSKIKPKVFVLVLIHFNFCFDNQTP
jgi:hypothetical protein